MICYWHTHVTLVPHMGIELAINVALIRSKFPLSPSLIPSPSSLPLLSLSSFCSPYAIHSLELESGSPSVLYCVMTCFLGVMRIGRFKDSISKREDLIATYRQLICYSVACPRHNLELLRACLFSDDSLVIPLCLSYVSPSDMAPLEAWTGVSSLIKLNELSCASYFVILI